MGLKRATSTYQAGRCSPSWIKCVVRHRSPMIVGGFIPGGGTHGGGLGILLVGAHNTDGELCYCGHVGTGMSHRVPRGLLQRLGELAEPLTPFTGPIPATDSVAGCGPRL